MNPTRHLLLAFLAVTALAIGQRAEAQNDTLAAIQQAKKIRIAMDVGLPPYAMKDDKLELIGSEVELAKLLAADLGVALEVVPTTGPNRIPFLTTNKADIVISTLAITPEREKVIDFSVPYGAALNVVAAPKSLEIKSLADLSGKKIAVTRGTTNDTEVTKGAPKDAEIVRFDDEATSLTALVSNQLDIVAQNPSFIATIQKRNPAKQLEIKFVLKQIDFAIGVRKGDAQLKAWLDQWIAANLANGKLSAMHKKYHGVDLPASLGKAR